MGRPHTTGMLTPPRSATTTSRLSIKGKGPHAHSLAAAAAAAFASRSTQIWRTWARLWRAVDAYGDHHACPRTGLLARRAKPLEHAWVHIAREAVGPEGQQQWLARTSARDVGPADHRRLDLAVLLLTREGRSQPSIATRDGAALSVAARRKHVAHSQRA